MLGRTRVVEVHMKYRAKNGNQDVVKFGGEQCLTPLIRALSHVFNKVKELSI